MPIRRASWLEIPTWLGLSCLIGCASYDPAPVEPTKLLEELDRVHLADLNVAWISSGTYDPSKGLTREEACAVAFRANPALRARRAELEVSRARFEEAGLLSDPVIGWDGVDVLADLLTNQVSTSSSYLSGLSLSWDLPRPGELDAEEAIAQAEILQRAAQVRVGQWRLAQDVLLAYLDLLLVRRNQVQTKRLLQVSGRIVSHFQRARAAGAATALQESLARVSLGGVEAKQLELAGSEQLARQKLNGLLGLRPVAAFLLETHLAAFHTSGPKQTPRQLTQAALKARPDLRVLLAEYRQAEARLRLEVARQWPQISIGTGLAIQLPFFSLFNQPAIASARRARDAARARILVAVHRIRGEVYAAHLELVQAHRLLQLYRSKLQPQADRILKLTQRAFRAREVTLVEILAAQTQLLQTRSRALAARARCAAARIRLDTLSGRLPLPPLETPKPSAEEKPQ